MSPFVLILDSFNILCTCIIGKMTIRVAINHSFSIDNVFDSYRSNINCVRSGVAFLLLTHCIIEGDTHLYALIQVYAYIFHLHHIVRQWWLHFYYPVNIFKFIYTWWIRTKVMLLLTSQGETLQITQEPTQASSLTKGYDPVHIPSLHPWYISRQIPREAPSNGGYEWFPLRFRLINTLVKRYRILSKYKS